MKYEDFAGLFAGHTIPEDALKAAHAKAEADETSAAAQALKAQAAQKIGAITAAIEQTTGAKYAEGVEFGAYVSKAFGTAGAKYETELTRLTAELEAAKKTPAGSPDIEKLQQKVVELEAEKQKLGAKHAADVEGLRRGFVVDAIAAAQKVNPALDAAVVETYKESIRAKALGVKVIKGTSDGKTVEYVADADGLAPMVREGKPVTYTDYVAGLFAPIAEKTPGGGAGQGPGGTPPAPPAPAGAIAGKTQAEAYTLEEARTAKLPLTERRAALAALVRNADFLKLPIQ